MCLQNIFIKYIYMYKEDSPLDNLKMVDMP